MLFFFSLQVVDNDNTFSVVWILYVNLCKSLTTLLNTVIVDTAHYCPIATTMYGSPHQNDLIAWKSCRDLNLALLLSLNFIIDMPVRAMA